jgi:hypothetical protein
MRNILKRLRGGQKHSTVAAGYDCAKEECLGRRYGPRVPSAAGDVYMDHSCAYKGNDETAWSL